MGYKLLAIIALAATVAAVTLYVTHQNKTGYTVEASNGPILTKAGEPVESWVYDAFQMWSAKHKKLYGSLNEKAYRLNVFRDNVLFIKQHRTEKHSYNLTINHFADLTQEEFKAKYLTLKADSKKTSNPVYLNTENLPDAVDWRTQGIVAPVKNQGQCGSCWAFSAVAALEGIFAQKQGHLETLSEQQLVDCSGPQGNEGCNGGLMDSAFQYVQAQGLQTASEYPYTARDGKCKAQGQSHQIKGFADVPENDNDQLAAAAAQGIVSVAIEADTMVFQFYGGGVFDNKKCGTDLDHGVSVVGYGTDNGKPYWTVRNSWGSIWGESGYIRILKATGKSEGLCGIAKMASYPTL